ncbi:MAG: hypothetical protein FWC89_04185 [Defluviitaleaceae bacterium]|nr:hypothetical protein [Defluviitaleaceae bacterium]
MQNWNPYDSGKTISTTGIDNGVIINDEEFLNDARITLESDGHAPYSISCGIYGVMFHTAFAKDHADAINKYEEMKAAIVDFINDKNNTDVSDWCGWFADKF